MTGGLKPAFGCHLPPPLPPNTVIYDIRGKPWTLGKVLGHGGFGAIYLTQPGKLKRVDDGAEYVVKVEPHSNGPLFVELHALLKFGRESARVDWKPRQGNKPVGWVGLPFYETHGSFRHQANHLRFLTMSRFGADLEKVFKSGQKPLPLAAVLNIGVQVLNSLEFIHSNNYCHNDIKAANILMDTDGCDVFLVDFGLACKYISDQGFHCDGGPDDRKAHDGTLEYTSRDAHTGAHSRRGDLESLGYCMLHWAGARLPWCSLLEGDPELVQASKETCLADIGRFLSSIFRPTPPPSPLLEYWRLVLSLEFNTQPNYEQFREILTEGLEDLGSYPHDRLQFSGKTLKVRSRKSDIIPVQPQPLQEEAARRTRSKNEVDGSLSGSPDYTDPVLIMREASKVWAEEEEAKRDSRKEEDFKRRQEEVLENPTPEMTRLINMRVEREKERQKLTWKEQLAEFNRRKAISCMELSKKETTPQMDEVIAIRTKRLASNISTPSPEPSDDDDEVEETKKDSPGKIDPKEKEVEEEPASESRLRSLRRRNTVGNLNQKPGETKKGARRRSVPSLRTPPKSMRSSSRLAKIVAEEPESPSSSMKTPEKSNTNKENSPNNYQHRTPHRSPHESYVDCEICSLNLNVKSYARHLRTIHKRTLPATPARGSTGFTPVVKKSRSCRNSPTEDPEDNNDDEDGEEDCPVCDTTMPVHLLNRHYEDNHSSTHGVRRCHRRVEDVSSRLARVSVSSERSNDACRSTGQC